MSISKRIVLSFLGVCLIIGLLAGVSFYHDIARSEQAAVQLAETTAEDITFYISSRLDPLNPSFAPIAEDLQFYADRFRRLRGKDMAIVDANEKIIADAVPCEVGTVFEHDPGNEVGLTLKDGKTRSFVEKSSAYPQGIKLLVVPIRLENGKIAGGLVVEYSQIHEKVAAEIRHGALDFLLLFAGGLLLAVLIGFSLARKVSRPLRELHDATGRISSGDLDARVSVDSSDEFGDLALSFNRMAVSLKENVTENAVARKNLESEIRERIRIEDELRVSSILTKTLIDAIPDMVFFKDASCRHLVVNRAFETFVGVRGEDAVGKTNEELLPPGLAEACTEGDFAVMKGGATVDHEEVSFRDGREVYFRTIKVPIFDASGVLTGLVGVVQDITEKRSYEEALRKSEETLRTIFDAATDAIFLLELDGRFIDVNRVGHERLGYTKEEMVSFHIAQLDPPEFAARVPERFCAIESDGYAVFESAHRRKDGTVMPVEVSARTIELHGRKVVLSLVRDITERKSAEEKIKAALLEKEILLKEIHHRVKNNLQVISGMLGLQAGYIEDAKTRALFEESLGRIDTMSLVHEKLYGSGDLARIDFAEYSRDLIDNLSSLLGLNTDRVGLKAEVQNIVLDITKAIPCGLIINELITNSLKHAFPAGRKGLIVLSMSRDESGAIVLRVTDDGVGFPEGLDPRNTKSLGLQLVNALAAQIDGTIEILSGERTGITVRFPG